MTLALTFLLGIAAAFVSLDMVSRVRAARVRDELRCIARDEFARIERERADAQRESVAADLKMIGERAR